MTSHEVQRHPGDWTYEYRRRRRAREEDSDRTPRKSGSEAEESSVSHDAVDEAETDGNVDEAGTEPGDTDEAEESFASDDDPDAGEKLFDPSSESDSDGFLAGHDPSYDTLPTSFSMAEEALRDCSVGHVGRGSSAYGGVDGRRADDKSDVSSYAQAHSSGRLDREADWC